MEKYRLAGGILLTPYEIVGQDLLLSGGKIEAVIPKELVVSSDYRVIDCTGMYISPGFVDIHQHGGGGNDYMDTASDAYLNITETHLAHGTTSVLPTLTSARPEVLEASVHSYLAATKDSRIRTNLLGLHIEGPYLSPIQAGAQKPDRIRVFCPEEYRDLTKLADGHLKRWSVAPEVEGAKTFADFATRNGITLSIAHSDADYDTVLQAYDWGFHHVTHLYSATSTITRRGGFRFPGVLESAYLIDDMNVEIIADGCHLPPSLLNFVTKFKKNENICLITDAMSAAGQNTTHSFLGGDEDALPVLIEDGVAKLMDRSAFAGSIATADRLLRTMLSIGLPITTAVQMLTVNPLRMMNLSVKKGQLLPGYDADLCVFGQDIQVKQVFCNGVLVKE